MASVSMATAQRRAEVSLVPGPCCLLPANRETQEERLTLATDDYKDFLFAETAEGSSAHIAAPGDSQKPPFKTVAFQVEGARQGQLI